MTVRHPRCSPPTMANNNPTAPWSAEGERDPAEQNDRADDDIVGQAEDDDDFGDEDDDEEEEDDSEDEDL